MDSSLLNALPNLGVGVAAVAAIYLVSRAFIDYIQTLNDTHMKALQEREDYLREVEHEMRTSILAQLSENTAVMKEVITVHKLSR